jgi:hypothetical protein
MQNILYIYYRYIVKSVYGDIQCTYIISTSLYTLYTLLTIQTSVWVNVKKYISLCTQYTLGILSVYGQKCIQWLTVYI